MFFSPDQVRKRIGDWGREELDRRFAEAWRIFAPVVEQWVDVVVQHGPDALEQVWHEVQAGWADPRTDHVITPRDGWATRRPGGADRARSR